MAKGMRTREAADWPASRTRLGPTFNRERGIRQLRAEYDRALELGARLQVAGDLAGARRAYRESEEAAGAIRRLDGGEA